MQRRKLEALAEAIVHVSGYREPGSTLYLARNPGGLRAFKPEHLRDADGNRIFGSVIDGLQALLFDTALKLEGMSKACLQPSDTLQDFAVSCGQPFTAADAYAKFLRKALSNESISRKTALAFLLEE
jgi:hypothetical protein